MGGMMRGYLQFVDERRFQAGAGIMSRRSATITHPQFTCALLNLPK